jgi:hypothetical protein
MLVLTIGQYQVPSVLLLLHRLLSKVAFRESVFYDVNWWNQYDLQVLLLHQMFCN